MDGREGKRPSRRTPIALTHRRPCDPSSSVRGRLPYTTLVAGISPRRLDCEAASCPIRMFPRRSGTRPLPKLPPSPSNSTRRSTPPRRVIDRLASFASSRSRTSISSSTARSSAVPPGGRGVPRGGSRVARAIKALFLGGLAAGIGAVIYYAIIRMTGLNIGLIAVVVGVMVGGAVRKGSGNRGGPFYQGVAILLTYLSIVAMNVPLILEGVFNQAREERAAKDAARLAKGDGAQAKVPGQPGAGDVPKRTPDAEGPAQQPRVKIAEPKKADPGNPGDDDGPPPDPSRLFRVLIVLMGFFLAYPVLEATQAPISVLSMPSPCGKRGRSTSDSS